MRSRITRFIFLIQTILLLAHALVYKTVVHAFGPFGPEHLLALRVAFLILWLCFVPATFLAFNVYNLFARVFYIAAAVWIGFLDFLFLASVVYWLDFLLILLFRLDHLQLPTVASLLFGIATGAGLYGLANAAITRVRRIRVALPGLPPSWRGRTAALVSDTHLGHVRGARFSARIAALIARQNPDIVFFVGDMFDGTSIDARRMAEPWKSLAPPFGVYFVSGNHEEFRNTEEFLAGIAAAGMRVLDSEKVDLDGLQIAGIPYHEAHPTARFAAALERVALDPARPGILLLHEPRDLSVSEKAGVSLQLSGHTHGGQIFPFTWFTRRVFRDYTWGLARFGRMQVYTSCGAGTWGPPLRVGTIPEIVLITFE